MEPPEELVDWMREHGATSWVPESLDWPGVAGKRHYVLTTVDFDKLQFSDHTYNPRTPSEPKVKELLASIRQLSLLSPLTCAYLERPATREEPVVLVDGRHRFNALQELALEDKSWHKGARIDLKVFWGLSKSDLHVLATYLNRTRRPLRRGEYYKAIVKIFEEKKIELESATGHPVKEARVFDSISTRELADRNFDLSIGRIVGMTAFDEEEDDSWYPLVGTHQNQRYPIDDKTFYCPLTAGNLAEFLRYLCLPHPYDDFGEKRAVEIGNVLELGRLFRKTVLVDKIRSPRKVTMTTVACKFWCLAALGSLMVESEALPEGSSKASVLSSPEQNLEAIKNMLASYSQIMKEQAQIVRKYKGTADPSFLTKAWSHQTQRDQVKVPLKQALVRAGIKFRSRG